MVLIALTVAIVVLDPVIVLEVGDVVVVVPVSHSSSSFVVVRRRLSSFVVVVVVVVAVHGQSRVAVVTSVEVIMTGG